MVGIRAPKQNLVVAELDGMVTYDDRLAGAARAHGVHVTAPG